MSIIGDSDAYLKKDRLLAQNQAALSLLQGKLDKPGLTDLIWLDLGCGKGQIIVNLEHNIGKEERKKITYVAYDIIEEHLSITLKKAESLHFKKIGGEIGGYLTFSRFISARK